MSWFENLVPISVQGLASAVNEERRAVLDGEILRKKADLTKAADPGARASEQREIPAATHYQSRQLGNNMLKPRKRKTIPHPSPEALAAQDRRSREERASKDKQKELLKATAIDDQSQAHARNLRQADDSQEITIAAGRMEPGDTWSAVETKQNRADILPTSVTYADSMYVPHRPFQKKLRQRCSYKPVDAVPPNHSSTKSRIVVSTQRRSTRPLPIKRTNLNKMIQSPPFHISRAGVPASQVYTVKHCAEKGSSVGKAWQQQEKRMYFFEEIQYTKIEYAPGDILNITFPDGPGGYAKLVEMRGTEDVFIVVQWIYSREDVASIGGKLPPLDWWPEDSCVLTDHFQVLGVENVEDKRGPVPLEDLYWQISGNSLRSLDEINRKLEMQLT